MIGDTDFNVSKLYGMLPAAVSGDPLKRTPADNQTVRNVFVIGPDKKVKLILVYPMTTGRNFDEVLRVIDSLQMTAKHKVATPVNWKQGDDVIIAGSVSDEDAKKTYPQGWKAPKPYIRIVPITDFGGGRIAILPRSIWKPLRSQSSHGAAGAVGQLIGGQCQMFGVGSQAFRASARHDAQHETTTDKRRDVCSYSGAAGTGHVQS